MKKLIALILLVTAQHVLAQTGTLQSKPTATTPAGDDWLLVQGNTNGMRKLAPTFYQPFVTAGTTGQYWRGDKTWQTLGSAALVATSAFDAAGSASTAQSAAATDATTKANAAQAASLQKTSNLSDLASVSTARSNLGLGSLATQSGTFSGISSGTNTGDQTNISGNAGTATTLQTTRAINGTNFNGSANITIPTIYTANGVFAGTRTMSFTGTDYLLINSGSSDGTFKTNGKTLELSMSSGSTGEASIKLTPYYSASDAIQIYNGLGYMRVGAGGALGSRFAISPSATTAGLYITQAGSVAVLPNSDSTSDVTLNGTAFYCAGTATFADDATYYGTATFSTGELHANVDAYFLHRVVVQDPAGIKLLPSTLSAIGSASTAPAGALAYCTDLTSTTSGATASGGGSGKHLVVSDGTNWIVQ